jgi:hypothetical protein
VPHPSISKNLGNCATLCGTNPSRVRAHDAHHISKAGVLVSNIGAEFFLGMNPVLLEAIRKLILS